VFWFTDIQPTLLWFCGADSFIPHFLELEHSIEKLFHSLLSKNEDSPGGFRFEAEINFFSKEFTFLEILAPD